MIVGAILMFSRFSEHSLSATAAEAERSGRWTWSGSKAAHCDCEWQTMRPTGYEGVVYYLELK